MFTPRSIKSAKRQLKYIKLLEKDLNITGITETPSTNILLGNVGLLCGNNYKDLINLLSPFETIKDIFLFPNKTYSLVTFCDIDSASFACETINGHFSQILGKVVYTLRIADDVCCLLLDKCQESYKKILNELPNGLQVIDNVLTEEEEARLINLVDWESDGKIECLKNRKVKHFGCRFDYNINGIVDDDSIDDIPEELMSIIVRLKDQQLIENMPDQVTVNRYDKGQGIPQHIDTHSCCENEIVSLSLGSDIVMDFECSRSKTRCSVQLPRRSAMIMREDSRYAWSHGIACRKFDAIMDSEQNRLILKERGTRISFTLRKFKENGECRCHFREFCDSQKSKEKMIMKSDDIHQMENEFVYKVYDQIAGDFDRTRYKPWPRVKKFLDSLPPGSIVCDIGCGNGKYLNQTDHTFNIGCDTSIQLLQICRKRSMEVLCCNILNLPFKEASMDHCICIAVLHHLASKDRRINALEAISRLLVVGGTCLVYVWALEQVKDGNKSVYLKSEDNLDARTETGGGLLPVHCNRTQFKQQDLFVPWKSKQEDKEFLRYYHVFREGELENLLAEVPGVKLVESYYDQGNWCIIFAREK